MLIALEMFLGPTSEIVLLGDPTSTDTNSVLQDLRLQFIPNKVVAMRSANQKPSTASSKSLDPIFAGKSPLEAQPTLFLCENFSCQAPVSGKEAEKTINAL